MFSSKLPNRLSKVGGRFAHQSSDYQYWQRSQIPSMHFQKSLPRLPIPKLEQTCERYLNSQEPLLSNEAFQRTEKYVSEFRHGPGKNLQELLTTHNANNKNSSYISQPWFDMYLSDRKPLPLNYNPALVCIDDARPQYNNQLLKAVNLIISSLRFYKSLNSDLLEPEVYHMDPKKSDTKLFRTICSKVPSALSWYASYLLFNAYPLDMSQYYNLFNTTRIPQVGMDRIEMNKSGKHIVVQYKGNFYVVDVLDNSNNVKPANEILGSIKSILDSSVSPSEFPIGVLTTLDRNDWAKLRLQLVSLGNEKSLSYIDSALFNVCLDGVCDKDPFNVCRQFLHSDGKNRWFDKSLSLIVTENSLSGINFEHSWGDGVAVLRFLQDIYKDFQENPQVHPGMESNVANESLCKLEFHLDDALKSAIAQACKDYDKICNSLDVNAVQMEGLGKHICKKFSLSPDAIMQLGFQVAYHKLHGKFVGSYESCSTAAFKYGRTETIRPCTIATKNFALAINSNNSLSNQELLKLIMECSKLHGQLTKNAAMGQGFDRHLFALKLYAKEKINLYEDDAYKALNYNIISTSTLSSPVIALGAFGPVVSDGFGIAYEIKKNALRVLVTTYLQQANGSDFVAALQKSYEEILSVLKNN